MMTTRSPATSSGPHDMLSQYGQLVPVVLPAISGVVLSWRLDGYLETPAIAVAACIAVLVPRAFSRQISGDFVRTFVKSFGLAAAVVACSFGLLLLDDDPFGLAFAERSVAMSILIGSAIGLPVGICSISYERQPGRDLEPLPEALDSCVRSTEGCVVYNELVEYVITIVDRPDDDRVIVEFEGTFHVRNRTKESQVHTILFDPAGASPTFTGLVIDDVQRDIDDKTYHNGFGRKVSSAVPGRETSIWRVDFSSSFHRRDSELYGSYEPAAKMVVTIRRPPDTLDVTTQSLLPEHRELSRRANGDRVFQVEGLLPFQGVRVFWGPTGG